MKTLIIDEVHPVLLQKLSVLDVAYEPEIKAKDVLRALGDVEILIVRSKLQITSEYIQAAPNLKLIGRLGSGMDNIDLEAAQNKGVVCLNAPEGNRDAVAEQTIGMLLSLLHHINKSSLEVKNYKWERKKNSGVELGSLTVGIIGYGNVGMSLAQKLSSFGCEVLCYDKFRTSYGDAYAQETPLPELIHKSDVLSLHVPLNSSSYQMVNAQFLKEVKDGAYLLNLCRGEVVVTRAIVNALESKKIAGCALDVLENENLNELSKDQKEDFEYLIHNPNVLLTPHIAGLTKNSYKKLAEILAEKVLNWYAEQPFIN